MASMACEGGRAAPRWPYIRSESSVSASLAVSINCCEPLLSAREEDRAQAVAGDPAKLRRPVHPLHDVRLLAAHRVVDGVREMLARLYVPGDGDCGICFERERVPTAGLLDDLPPSSR